VQCKLCGADQKELAAKTIGRNTAGISRCNRLACGHAWHVAVTSSNEPIADADAGAPTSCNCSEIATVNALLVEGRQYELSKDELSSETFTSWLPRVLEALDGIPAESGSPSLARSAATIGRSPNSGIAKKTVELNALLGRAIKAVS